MTAEVVDFTGITRLDMPAERVLAAACEVEFESAIVIGWTKAGEYYFASSIAGGPEVLWLLELTKLELMKPSLKDEG